MYRLTRRTVYNLYWIQHELLLDWGRKAMKFLLDHQTNDRKNMMQVYSWFAVHARDEACLLCVPDSNEATRSRGYWSTILFTINSYQNIVAITAWLRTFLWQHQFPPRHRHILRQSSYIHFSLSLSSNWSASCVTKPVLKRWNSYKTNAHRRKNEGLVIELFVQLMHLSERF